MQQQDTRCIRGELCPFFPENREECSESDEKGSESNMKSSLWIKTLFRSPVRTIVTWLLLLAAAFQFPGGGLPVHPEPHGLPLHPEGTGGG